MKPQQDYGHTEIQANDVLSRALSQPREKLVRKSEVPSMFELAYQDGFTL